jgi:tungstate transport system permease protein
LALPVGYVLAHGRFPARRELVTVVQTLTVVPTVVVGLILYGILSRQGVMGGMGWLFTPVELLLRQTILAFPIISHARSRGAQGAGSADSGNRPGVVRG